MSTDYTSVFVSGIFNVLHPGHIRLLRFAQEIGNELIVGVLSDPQAGSAATVPQLERLEAVSALRMVDRAYIVEEPIEQELVKLRPDFVVKGSEHAGRHNVEEEILDSFGGRLIFGSGQAFAPSIGDLDCGESPHVAVNLSLVEAFMGHHRISIRRLQELIGAMSGIRVLVVGDAIVDEYITCNPLGMSREDPTLVVTPVETKRFLGGAAIVAAHAGSLGQTATLLSVVGADSSADFVERKLSEFGVSPELCIDKERPTTLKQRWRASGKNLLKVSRLDQNPIPPNLQDLLADRADALMSSHDLLLLSDFNYGVLPQTLVDRLTSQASKNGVVIAADSQSSSQVGDVSRFRGMHLLTPTEYEARLATRNFDGGLVVLADELREASEAQLVLMTLGADGVLIRGSVGDGQDLITDRLPAMNSNPLDTAGAGDSLLVSSAMALASGATMHEAALLGTIAAALEVSTLGNRPISGRDLHSVIGT
jgi:rfaE bifunctional protein kinase chain/domain